MPRYRVVPKNPASASEIVEADGHTWEVERVVFWREHTVVVTETDKMIHELEIDIVPGATLKAGPGQAIKTRRPPVAEFAVDWVAGVVLESQGG